MEKLHWLNNIKKSVVSEVFTEPGGKYPNRMRRFPVSQDLKDVTLLNTII